MKRRCCMCLALLAAAVLSSPVALAGGPRWVTGLPYFYSPGWPINWYTTTPQYFTDPGDLSPYVSHAQADAIVDAAAGVWNVPVSLLALTRGGTLDEDISGANVYTASTGIVFPADVQPANFAVKQIAVIYDRDGSVTDLLLGTGASSPSSCRQNAVTESVDLFRSDGKIQHALLVLNGRCTGPAPEQQLQLQYQLMRAFGRVLGLGWSQTNDNVFTGSPRPTYQQALHWPVMHPIDVICGPYTYQCIPSPFTLRDDDISSLASLYPVQYGVPAGKANTLARANQVEGTITFPNGQGMQGVNVVVHRMEQFWSYPEDWESVSGVTGYRFRRDNGNPISGDIAGPATAGMGSTDTSLEGGFMLFRIPLYDWQTVQNLVVSTQPINPLYVGPYAVGPYARSAVAPSGSSNVRTLGVQTASYPASYTSATADAASSCDASAGGAEAAPNPVDASGWWNGGLCSYGAEAWFGLTVQPNRSFTVEVTAKDEQGATTTVKALPVTGLWLANDALGSKPTVAAAPRAFNSTVSGMTALPVAADGGALPRTLRMVIADERGDGRPDYNYQARVLYAESITPASMPAEGGAVTIQGMGFRPGNRVTINGAAATVTAWTSTTITATAPSLRTSTTRTVDVTVRDEVTGASSTMMGALQYAAAQKALLLVAAPSGPVFTGVSAAAPFTVRALDSDGVTALAGVPIQLSAVQGTVRFDACQAASCTLTTDAQGNVSSTVTPLAAGGVQLSASSSIGNVTAAFPVADRVQTILPSSSPVLYVAAGVRLDWPLAVFLSDNAASSSGVTVQWNGGGMSFGPTITTTDAASATHSVALVGPLQEGAHAAGTACAWTSICTTFSAFGVGASQWRLEANGMAETAVPAGIALPAVTLRVVDADGHPVAGVPVEIHQTLEPWAACADEGRCPVAPVYKISSTSVVSALDGSIVVSPLDQTGEAVTCNVAVAAGPEAFLSFTLSRQP